MDSEEKIEKLEVENNHLKEDIEELKGRIMDLENSRGIALDELTDIETAIKTAYRKVNQSA